MWARYLNLLVLPLLAGSTASMVLSSHAHLAINFIHSFIKNSDYFLFGKEQCRSTKQLANYKTVAWAGGLACVGRVEVLGPFLSPPPNSIIQVQSLEKHCCLRT